MWICINLHFTQFCYTLHSYLQNIRAKYETRRCKLIFYDRNFWVKSNFDRFMCCYAMNCIGFLIFMNYGLPPVHQSTSPPIHLKVLKVYFWGIQRVLSSHLLTSAWRNINSYLSTIKMTIKLKVQQLRKNGLLRAFLESNKE